MSIPIACASCGRTGRVPDSAAGRLILCPACGHRERLPAASEPALESTGDPIPAVAARGTASSRPTDASPAPPAVALPRWAVATIAGGAATLCVLIGLVGFLLFHRGNSPSPDRTVPAVASGAGEVRAGTAFAPVASSKSVGGTTHSRKAGDPEKAGESTGAVALEGSEAHRGELNASEIVERCDPSIALIRGKISSGTGFLVRPGVIATNAHVIAEEFIDNLEVRFPAASDESSGPFAVELLDEDSSRDLAFLAVKTDLPPLEVASRYRHRKGEDVTVIGSPGFGENGNVLENAVTRGVMSVRTKVDGQDFYQLGIAINPGNSGGPVLDSRGQVVGVATLKAVKQEGVAFCIPVEDLNASLGRLDKPRTEELETLRARHRMPLTFMILTAAGAIQAMAMDLAIANAADRAKVREGLTSLDRTLFSGVRDEARIVVADEKHYSPEIRARIGELSDNFADLRTLADQTFSDSPGDLGALRPRVALMKKAHLRAVTSLMGLLKVEVPENVLAMLGEGGPKDPGGSMIVLVDPGSRSSLHDRFGVGPRISPRYVPRIAIPQRPSSRTRPRPGRIGR